MKNGNLRKNLIINTLAYLGYAYNEALNFSVYLNAGIVGTIICFFTSHYSIVPFIVPLFVQIIARSNVKYRHRHINALVELPAQIEDPAFIMNKQGDIILSTGKTQQVFENHEVTNIGEFVGSKGLKAIIDLAADFDSENSLLQEEVHSDVTQKWYEVKAKPAKIKYGEKTKKILVWFRDISRRKAYDLRLQDLLSYSGSLISSLHDLVKSGSVYDHLASFMLTDYEAVFITRIDGDGNLVGNVFKNISARLVKSSAIGISKESVAPIFVARRTARILSNDISSYDTPEEFINDNPFDQRVLDFIDRPIRNFITYHEADVSIIAFNYKSKITAYEKQFIEVLLNTSRTMVILVDLAQENDEQFIQKIMGLCVAAEYSDEIAGNHVLRVNKYSRFIAEKLEMDHRFVEAIGQVAALHDIGKVAMPDLIKNPDEYTMEDRSKMQMHTVYGAKIIDTIMKHALKEDSRLTMARNIAMHHHQTHNGKGYPCLKQQGRIIGKFPDDYRSYLGNEPLSGTEIPLESLIVALADRYDALRCESHYKPLLSHSETMDIMACDDRLKISGEEWYGPELWSVFQKYHQEFDNIFESLK